MEHTEKQQQEAREERETTTGRPDASPRPSPRNSRDSEWEVLSVSSEEVQQLIPPTSKTAVATGLVSESNQKVKKERGKEEKEPYPSGEFKAGTDMGLVCQMMQEDTTISSFRSNPEAIYDPYGFRHGGGDGSEDEEEDKLKKTIDPQVDESSASHMARWDNFMIPHNGGKDLSKLVKSNELKNLIRGGIPRRYRGPIWRWCILSHLGSRYAPNIYQEILKENAGKSSMATKQIELDLHCPLPTNKYYNSQHAPGIAKLRRVLVAYSWYDTQVRYLSGFNLVAAIALLLLEEEYAFWCLVTIFNCLLPPNYYNRIHLGTQIDLRVLHELITEKMPRLSAHLDACGVDISLIAIIWFRTIFIDTLPVETMLRVWDTFLLEGSKVVFRYAIAIFKHSEESLLSLDDTTSIFMKLKTMAQEVTAVQKLTQIAFNDPIMRNISKKMIQQKRRIQLKFELEKLDKHRTLEHARHSRIVADSDSDDDPDD